MRRLALISLLLTGCAEPRVEFADGDSVTVAEINSTYVIVNHWATWCPPCREEIPELNELSKALDQTQVRLFGFGEEYRTGQRLLDDISEMGIKFPVLTASPAERWRYETPSVLPTTAIIAPGGDVKQLLVGPQTKASLLEALDQWRPARS